MDKNQDNIIQKNLSSSNLSSSYYFREIFYHKDLWFATAALDKSFSSKFLLYSKNGINWFKTNLNNVEVVDITYGLNQYIAVCFSSNPGLEKIYISQDGINWNPVNSNNSYKDYKFRGISFNPIYNIFVAVAYSSPSPKRGKIVYSYDGKTWYENSNFNELNFFSIKYNSKNNIFVAVSYEIPSDFDFSNSSLQNSKSKIIISHDGINWKELPGFNDKRCWTKVISSSEGITAIAWSNLDNIIPNKNTKKSRIVFSKNGQDWIELNDQDNILGWYNIKYGNGTYVAIQNVLFEGYKVVYSSATYSFNDSSFNWKNSNFQINNNTISKGINELNIFEGIDYNEQENLWILSCSNKPNSLWFSENGKDWIKKEITIS